MGNDVDMWKMAKICWKSLKHLTNGLNMTELTERFWEMDKKVVKWLRYMRCSLSISGTA